jgi:hypothetical protein
MLIATVGAAAMAVAPAALAVNPDHPNHGNHGAGNNGQGHVPAVQYVFKGTYNADGTVTVTGGNSHVKKAALVDTPVLFDFATAKVVVADNNADGTSDLTDVAADDAVVVKARLPKSDPVTPPVVARQLVDQTHPADSTEAPEVPEAPTE